MAVGLILDGFRYTTMNLLCALHTPSMCRRFYWRRQSVFSEKPAISVGDRHQWKRLNGINPCLHIPSSTP